MLILLAIQPGIIDRIEAILPTDAVLLDVGGWAKPLARADYVLDLMPYETRGLYGSLEAGTERFSQETWIQRDICDRARWPFADDQFDFAVCAHTLEDVRDPVWVCQELQRVAKAGYIETPSRLEEQSRGVFGPWVGWSHHHWLVEANEGSITFVFKPHLLHGKPGLSFSEGFVDSLTPEERVCELWWQGSFSCEERVFIDPDELDAYLGDFVARVLENRPAGRYGPRGLKRLWSWVTG